MAKILEIGTYPPPHNGWGQRIAFVRRQLERMGHVCVPLNIGERRRVKSSDYECVRSGWDYARKLLRYSLRGYLPHYHANGDSPKGFVLAMVAYLVSLLTGRRPVLTFHAGATQVYFPRAHSRKMVPVFKLLFGIPKVIICNNDEVKKLIVEYGVDPAKVVPIAPFSRQYVEDPPTPLPADVKRFLDDHAPVVFTYLECRPEYALDSLLTAIGNVARSQPQLGVIIAGAGREREEIRAYLMAVGIESRSLHLGAVDHGTFLAILRHVSVYLRSNEREGTSSSIRESLYLGTPVVANDSGNHPDGVMTYPHGDEAAMSACLQAILTEPAARRDRLRPDEITDTVRQEAELLIQCASSLGVPAAVRQIANGEPGPRNPMNVASTP